MEKSQKQLVIGLSALAAVVIGALVWFFARPEGGGSLLPGGSNLPPLPSEIVVESPDEARQATSDTFGKLQGGADAATTEYEQIRGSGSSVSQGASGALSNAQSVQSRVAELKRNGKEYLEDYLRQTYEAKGAFDTQKILSLPLGDTNAFERFLANLAQFDTNASKQIGEVLLRRTSYGIEFDENSLEGYLAKNYAKGNLDYAAMKEMPIRNELGLLFLMTEMFYSDHRSIIDKNLESVIAHKVSLIPKNNIINPRYQNLNRIHSFFQVAQGNQKVDAIRSLRESQLFYLQAGNYPLLKKDSDKTLFAEGSRLLEKYKSVATIEDVKSKDISGDLAAGKALLAKMEASEEFKKYYMGITTVNSFLAALEIVNGNPGAAADHIKRNESYQFVDADGMTRPSGLMNINWNYAIAYEATGDFLAAKGEKAAAKSAYESARDAMLRYSYARPHYVLPREQTAGIEKKIRNL